MTDISKRVPNCDDDNERGERGERGRRGHRGHRGHDGRNGDTGSTGATGPTGASNSGPQNVMALLARWKDTVPAGSTGPLAINGSSFDNIGMIRQGSLVGIHARTTQILAAGSLTCVATINGVDTILTVTMGIGDDEVSDVALAGVIPYAALDLIGVSFTTTADYAPAADLEVWLEVIEQTL